MSAAPTDPTPEEAVRAPGPWEHRNVSANGARFHIAEMGVGPPVLLLHGFPTYWYTWRQMLPVLAEAGYRAIAMDLRGYGGTDHTPRGYDPFTLSADLHSVVRALGYTDAAVIGHGWGAFIGWTAAALRPGLVRALVAVSMPHPVLLRKAIVSDGEQRRRSRYAVSFQVPRVPEKKLLADDAAAVGAYLHHWSGPGNWPDEVTERYFRRAFQYRATAHCALEYHRWALRSIPRPDGVRFINRMEQPILAPVLQIQGLADGAVLPGSVDGSEDFVVGDYRREDIEGIGHFPHEEDPEAFAGLVAPWLAGMLPTASGAAPAAGRPAGR